jgi:hypothetical protein
MPTNFSLDSLRYGMASYRHKFTVDQARVQGVPLGGLHYQGDTEGLLRILIILGSPSSFEGR